MRLVGPAGEQVGVVRIEDALRLAAESDLDLVEVAPQAKPPVCKLMDFGKYKYEAAVKAREARKNQTNTVLKEIRFRLKIDTHDYETKRGHALRFLGAGDKVKAMIQFRGREQQRPEMGIRLLQRFAEDVAEVGVIESSPRIDGRNMVMVIGPVKNKAEAKAEARRAAQKAEAKAANEAKASGQAGDGANTGGQRAPRERIDVTSEQAPLTQSLADLLPADLLPAEELSRPAEESAAEAPEAPAAPAPAPATKAAPEPAPAPKAAPAPAPAAKAAPESAPKAAPAPAAKAAPAPAPAPKAAPAPAPRPAAPKPGDVKPSAPKPTAIPKPAARPAAPKPAGRGSSKS
ncbi:translation initiation factor IF-3 [Arthrobacter sp. I2-34]|uniref:Translation initiation factor IF-3 n=1 Tax=Arthrobacter hankyongi TaxID=2904801 RepID=A0ABS9L107_9MICC|nr:translation initiation factor IF-3 [Arthrobacter hankyongi]